MSCIILQRNNKGHNVNNAIQNYIPVSNNKEIIYFNLVRHDTKHIKVTTLYGKMIFNNNRFDCNHDSKYKLPFFPLLLALLLVLIIIFYIMLCSVNLLFGFTWRWFFIYYVHRICSFLLFWPEPTKPAPCIFHFIRSPLKLLCYFFYFAKHGRL